MKIKFAKTISAALALAMTAGVIAGCAPTREKKAYDNRNDPLIFSILEVDQVFNPFFSTSATDSNVVGLTQISMLTNDKDGKVAYGDDEEVVVKDLEITDNGKEQDHGLQTTYKFVLKNDVRFSNGSYLTMKDVLFNLYVYLDPAYTGSATMYSTDIVGLKEYRTQASQETEQDAFMQQFQRAARTRRNSLQSAAEEILDEHNNTLSEKDFEKELENYQAEHSGNEAYAHLVEDYKKAIELFKDELKSDYTAAKDSFRDTIFVDKNGNEHRNLFTTDVEQFLYNEGAITWNKAANNGNGELSYGTGTPEATKAWTEERAIQYIYDTNIPDKIAEVVEYWVTASDLFTFITNAEMEEFFKEAGNIEYKNISGIKFANREEPVTVNGVTYNVPEYADDGHVIQGNEVLSITINNIDPKAIWNFGFTVAPMYYYSDAEHIRAFDYEENFGVERGSQTFLQDVVNNSKKIGLPVGAGPYVASKAEGGITDVESGDFFDTNILYYESNPYYLMGEPKIKKIRYQITPSTQMTNSLYSLEVTFAEPNAKPETYDEIKGREKDGFRAKLVSTLGYGYIGINAGKVPSLEVRQAIMHCINTQECVDYYKSTASPIYRSMSKESWAYPDDSTPYYPYIGGKIPEDLTVVNPAYKRFVESKGKRAGDTLTLAEQEEFIRGLVESASYHTDAGGVYVNAAGTQRLKYTFTIVGQETDHPAWRALNHARELLNQWGFEINVRTDVSGLQKLATGNLTVWAAAWGATIDPDMYQVYHKDSTATSVLSWGYRQILLNAGNRYSRENTILDVLSEYIEAARETNNQDERARIYSDALDKVMELAVELPTYQRNDLFAYDAWKLDESTLTPDSEVSAFKGLTSRMYNLSLVTQIQ